MLEQTLQIYQTQRGDIKLGEIYTSGLEMYTLGINDSAMNIRPTPIGGAGSGFTPGLSKEKYCFGIKRERLVDEETIARIVEQLRQPETDSTHGHHINYEEIVPGLKKLGKLTNLHIPLDTDKD